jgi:hypothetical protein
VYSIIHAKGNYATRKIIKEEMFVMTRVRFFDKTLDEIVKSKPSTATIWCMIREFKR